jgi:hypothetical protein
MDMAATSVDGDGIRLYVVGKNKNITEYMPDGMGMTQGEFSAYGTDVAATSWKAGDYRRVRVYVKGDDGTISEYCWGGDGWYDGEFSVNAQEVAVASWHTGGYYSAEGAVGGSAPVIHLRVYTREANNVVKERYWDGDGWEDGGYSGQAAHA